MEKEMYFVDDNGGSWQSLYPGELNSSSEQLQAAAYYNTMELTASQFESALSSMGSMYNSSGEISPPPLSCSYNNNCTTTSCYSTPLNSPPKLNLGAISLNARHGEAPLPSDPGFAERAAMNSCYGRLDLPYRCLKKMGSGNLSRVSSSKSTRGGASSAVAADEEEFSSISNQIPGKNAMNAKKRKAIAKNKAKEKVVKEDHYDAKRSKASEKDGEKAKNDQKQTNNSSKPPEPPKDYIHVRARRGQATDSHSLAERVRREKISERMKVLQDLVPGCSKVTGKSVMLDEIINYVQSLQRQVEFLSMKLATVNFDSNMETFLSKEGLQSHVSLPQTAHPFELSQAAYQFVNLQKLGFIQNVVANGTDVGSQFPGIWGNDLQTVLQTGSDPNQNPTFASQNFQRALTSIYLIYFCIL